jgi:hypothetical protein
MSVAMVPREKESWNDDRLDDLNRNVDEGFKDTREEFRAVRTEVQQGFAEVRSEISATNQVIVQLSGAMWATSVVGFLSVIATILLKV